MFHCISNKRKSLQLISYHLFNWSPSRQVNLPWNVFIRWCPSFTKISKLTLEVKYFWSFFNLKLGHFFGEPCIQFIWYFPGDFLTKVKQVNSQSDLISMSSFAGPSYLTIRSCICIILIWDPCIFNLYNLCQTGFNYTLQEPHQCALNFTEQITQGHFLLLQPSIRPIPAQVERAAKTLHRMSLCTPVSVPAKITRLLSLLS